MSNTQYQYNNTIGTKFVPIYTGDPISSLIATAGATIFASWTDWFTSPAKDANNLINSIKPELERIDARQRLALILATSQKISPRARDVGAEKLFLFYKNQYREDYKFLSKEDKIYYNNFLNNAIATQADGNNFWANSLNSMFTDNELNYNQNPINNLFQPSGSNQAGISPIVIVAIAGGAIYLLTRKKIKK